MECEVDGAVIHAIGHLEAMGITLESLYEDVWNYSIHGLLVAQYVPEKGDFLIVSVNPAALEMAGDTIAPGKYLCEEQPEHRDHSEDLGMSLYEWYKAVAVSGKSKRRQFFFDGVGNRGYWDNLTVRLSKRHEDADCCPEWTTTTCSQCPVLILMSFTNITEDVKAREQLKSLAELREYESQHDILITGIPNRVFMLKLLEEAVSREKRFGLIFADLNKFKAINDELGHNVGDRVLAEAASRMQSVIRPVDVIARWGGDEFLIFIDFEDDGVPLRKIGDRIQEEIEKPFEVEGRALTVGVSLGGIMHQVGTGIDEAIAQVDKAMYESKANKEGIVLVNDQMVQVSSRKATIRSAIREQLENPNAPSNHELSMAYQPIYDLNSLAIVGFEGLLRWRHAGLGNIAPPELIEICREYGLLEKLSLWTINQCYEQSEFWRAQFNGNSPYVAVNIEPDLLSNQAIKNSLGQCEELAIEITESRALEPKLAIVLSELKRLASLKILIDDLGTGYSSVNALAERVTGGTVFDALKLDKSISADKDLVPHWVGICRTFRGCKVIAEGLEHESDVARLIEAGCDYGQGYFLGRPMKAENAYKLISSQNTYG